MVGFVLLLWCTAAAAQPVFDLVAPGREAVVFVPGASGPLSLAAADLVSDVQKITGKRLQIVNNASACRQPCIALLDASSSSRPLLQEWAPDMLREVDGRWEAYRVRPAAQRPGTLIIAGADERGVMFGLYRLLQISLEVDPLYWWTGREPVRRPDLRLANLDLRADSPKFRFRGWFINDEDLLTDWSSGGTRFLAYPYYQRVISPELANRIYEAMLRLGYNTVIPSSFVNITNPPEALLVQEASRRGLFVSMHHVEPLGVSAFGFENHFARQGRSVPFSFFSQRDAFREAWSYFAAQWARYPNVIWQLGLRGVADRPVWHSDPLVPKDNAGRGKLISDAIAEQWAIVRKFDKRPQPLATTTLWMEGAALNREGHLRFPEGVMVIFADNGPGWKWEPDFFLNSPEQGRQYGVYQHHAFWAAGPHLAQGVSPDLAYRQIKLAVEKGDTAYAMLNVSNIREFPLGLAASAEMLWRYEQFDPQAFLKQWCDQRFGPAGSAAGQAYQQLFDGYVVPADKGTPVLLDGQMRAAIRRILSLRLAGREAPDTDRLATEADRQYTTWTAALDRALAAWQTADVTRRPLLETNLIAQLRLLRGLAQLLRGSARQQVDDAQAGWEEARSGLALSARGSWKDWYRGDRKMNLPEIEGLLREWIDREQPARPADAPVTVTDFSYTSSIDPNLTLRAKLAYPEASTARLPILVLMHGFRGQASDFEAATLRRFASSYSPGAMVVAVELRGRSGSDGKPDSGGREIYDIADAVRAVAKAHAARVDPEQIHIVGYSGGGANSMFAAARFPDLFRTATSFFGISDYGRTPEAGWYRVANEDQRRSLIAWAGAPEASRSAYDAREICASLAFYPGLLRLYHDREDRNVPVIQSERVLSCRPQSRASFTSATDPIRWIHINPNGDAAVRQAEREFLRTLHSAPPAAPLPPQGKLTVAGFVETRRFSLWLEDGAHGRADVTYDLSTQTFSIQSTVANWTLRLPSGAAPNAIINGQQMTGSRDKDGSILFRQGVSSTWH